MVLPASRGVPRAPRYSGDLLGRRTRFDYGGVTLCAAAFQPPRLRLRFVTSRCLCKGITEIPTTPQQHAAMVWALPVSLATTQGIIIIFFSSPYLDVSVQEVHIVTVSSCLQHDRFPHSDIHGSRVVCTSPWLFAAYHVLRRLREPRQTQNTVECELGRQTSGANVRCQEGNNPDRRLRSLSHS